MSYRYVLRSVYSSLEQVAHNDSFLIENDVSEWAIAHRLAVYLEPSFPGWDVDCEYNRQGLDGDGKRKEDGGIVRPDITIHRRGALELDHNLLVIELKKGAEEDDPEKVLEYTATPEGDQKFQYQLGLTLAHFDPFPREINWYQNGVWVSQEELVK